MVAIVSLTLSLYLGWMLSFDYCYLKGNMPESRRLILKFGFLVYSGFSSHVVGSICAGNEFFVKMLFQRLCLTLTYTNNAIQARGCIIYSKI